MKIRKPFILFKVDGWFKLFNIEFLLFTSGKNLSNKLSKFVLKNMGTHTLLQ